MKLQATSRRHTRGLTAGQSALRAPWLSAIVVWLLAGAALVWWLLALSARGAWQPVPVLPAPAVVAEPAAVARALGHREGAAPGMDQKSPVAGAHLRLLGVAAQPAHQGAALLSVDGQPPRPFRVGDQVSDAWVLQGVDRHRVRLVSTHGKGDDQASVLELTLPPVTR